jgi:hypothetical protein
LRRTKPGSFVNCHMAAEQKDSSGFSRLSMMSQELWLSTRHV